MTLGEPRDPTVRELFYPPRRLVVPILNGDDEVGGPLLDVEHVPLWCVLPWLGTGQRLFEPDLLRGHLLAPPVGLSAVVSLPLTDGGDEPLGDMHEGDGVVWLQLEANGGG